MPRPSSFTSSQLADRALHHFWVHGFHASSMDDLVKATGVSRHGIYQTFGGKRALFLACFEQYQNTVVSPAFEVVETPDASLSEVAIYFETQIARGESVGLPGPGCFVANSATEVAPADQDVMAEVQRHNDRLKRGFARALRNTARDHGHSLTEARAADLADVMVVFTNGLWSLSRSTSRAEDLRRSVRGFLDMILKGLT